MDEQSYYLRNSSHFSSTRATKFKKHYFELKGPGTENVVLTTKISIRFDRISLTTFCLQSFNGFE